MESQFHEWLDSREMPATTHEIEPDLVSFGRLWRVFMTARVAIASVLVILQAVIYVLGSHTDHWPIVICVTYLCATLSVRIWAKPKPPKRTFNMQWILTIGVDVLVFSLLDFLQSGGINYTPLFALPVLLSSVLGPILLAFGTAASVTLLLLADAWWSSFSSLGDSKARILQSGLSGSGFFLVALLANQLALRLMREEQQTKISQSATRMQTQVNELVMESLAEGVLVVDTRGVVCSVNPASRKFLTRVDGGYNVSFALFEEAAWQPLVDLMRRTFTTQLPQAADIILLFPNHSVRRLHVRTCLAESPKDKHESLCVMFLEDLREIEARIRTEKMAAMGRMSAAVAHEIRNPLAAISQANALLEEDLQDKAHLQLTAMVRQNAQRLAKLVDEVLNVSRVQGQLPAPQMTMLMLDETVWRISTEWATQNAALSRIRITKSAPNMAVWFEPEHLRRLIVNLLDNALRYASTSNQKIEVITSTIMPGQARLAVWSDGPPLENSVRTHLFEPFFSSESRSSGLGLYICRELCERYGALISYLRVSRGNREGNEFFIMLKPASQALIAHSPSFATMPASNHEHVSAHSSTNSHPRH